MGKSLLLSGLTSFCVLAGYVFANASNAVLPAGHLVRPLILVAVLGLAIGLLALVSRPHHVELAGGLALLALFPNESMVLAVSAAALALVVLRVLGRPISLAVPAVAASLVFALVGAIQLLPTLSFGTPVRFAPSDGPPIYLILLDGYPRVDVLAELGFDNMPFISEMEDRGFQHYPDARALHRTTYRFLTAMLVGRVDPDSWGTVEERRSARQEWKLPSGFVAISPPYGHTTLPHDVDIGRGVISTFEVALLTVSPVGRFAGGLILDAFRSHVEHSMNTLGKTDHLRVFAHIASPHPPYLFDINGEPAEPPACWPEACQLWDDRPASDQRLHGTLVWLNGLLVEKVDQILERRPDAVIVLFGDHGIRLADGPAEHDYLPLMLSRGLMLDQPQPHRILGAVLDRWSPMP